MRRNFDIISFNYAGHGASRGGFSFQASVDNSANALVLALRQSRREALPLFGVASCFATVPMLRAVHLNGEPLDKIVLINALPNLRWEKMVVDFLKYWRKSGSGYPTRIGLRAALEAYRDELLPNISHAPEAFGILSRHRVHWRRTLKDLLTIRRLETQPLRSTPVLCVYGQRDRLLKQIGFTDWEGYEALIKQICPRIQFWKIDDDHFLSGRQTRQRLIARVARFFLR